MATVSYSIKSILYRVQKSWAVLHVESHPKYLVLVQQNVIGEIIGQLNMENYQLSVVMYPRNIVLYILQPVI